MMKIYRLTGKNFKKILFLAEKILTSGGVVIGPTDTVYGIFGKATDSRIIKKIFKMKGRHPEKAFPIFTKDIATARKLAYISDIKAKFLEKVWPGPVTVVFHHKEKLPQIITGGLSTIGIRIPNHQFLRELLKRLDFPLVQTSANVSGKPPAKNVEEVKEYFDKQKIRPDLIIDGGEIIGQASTVINFTGREPIILRFGAVTKEELERSLRL
jgi:L-threonylcarbamoyladenylate synthase